MQPEGSDTPAQLLTPGTSLSPHSMPTPEPDINTPEAGLDGAASEGVELGREENDCIVVNPDRYPSVGLTGTAEKAIPKPRRA